MNINALDSATKKVFEKIAEGRTFQQFYLAGGSAVALHFGHRYSYDLDFFSESSFDSVALSKTLAQLGTLKTATLEDDTFLGTLDGVKISFFLYPYQRLFPGEQLGHVRVADPRDLVAMKIEAIVQRGTRRDFVDLYVLMTKRQWNLDIVIGWFRKKYQKMNMNLIYVMKSLVYFTDAEQDPELKMIKPVAWRDVKRFFELQVKNFRL